jgi:hypothetical protein
MKMTTASVPTAHGDHALVDQIGAKVGADGAFLDHLQIDRQRARTERDRQLRRALDGEAARDHGGAAQDRGVDVGGGEHLAVKDDGERLADIFGGQLGEFLAAGLVEVDLDLRLAGLLLEGLVRAGQLIALDPAQTLERHGARTAGIGRDFIARRSNARGNIGLRGGGIDQLEFQLGGLAQQGLQSRGILQARHLHHDAVGALTDDGRLTRAQRVDTLAHHFGGRAHRIGDRLIDARLGRRQHDRAAIDHLDVPVALARKPAPLVSGRIASRAASTSAGLLTMKLSEPSLFEMSPIWMGRLAFFRALRTSSSLDSRRMAVT